MLYSNYLRVCSLFHLTILRTKLFNLKVIRKNLLNMIVFVQGIRIAYNKSYILASFKNIKTQSFKGLLLKAYYWIKLHL